MTRQLTFDLPVRTAVGREDFFVSAANADAVTRLEDVAGWPGAKLALAGPEGSGKTHLAHVWAEATGGAVVPSGDLAALDVTTVDAPLAVDEADRLTPGTEQALFHLHNHMAGRALPLLLVGREAPARWEVTLPDLRSRLAATDVARIAAPDDALLAAVLLKLFADRQVALAPHLVDWLLPRMERSFAFTQALVAALDAEALARGGRITRPVAQTVLDRLTAT